MPTFFNSKYLIRSLIIISLFLTTLLSGVSTSEAEESYGWFAPKVEYIDNNITPCPAGTAALELWLVEGNSKTQITNSIGSWKVNIRKSLSNSSIISYKILSAGEKQSNVLCFDPTQNGIQVSVFDSSNYHEFLTPTIFPDTTDIISLSQMKGGHFRGYVHLVSKSSATAPYTESVCTSIDTNCVTIASTTPEFVIKNNFVSSMYDSNSVTKTKLYVQNQTMTTPPEIQSYVDDCANTYCYLDLGKDLPEGHYFWTFHQELDGVANTSRINSNPWAWSFANIPSSSLPPEMSFTIDKTPPISTVVNITASTTSNAPLDPVDIKFTNNVSDVLTGISSNRVYVRDPGGNIVFDQTYPAPGSSVVVTVSGLTKGLIYDIFTETTDLVGNIYIAPAVPYEVLVTYSPPQVALYNGTTNYGQAQVVDGVPASLHPTTNLLYGEITDKLTNPLAITGYRLCWSTTNNFTNYLATNDMTGLNCHTALWSTAWGYSMNATTPTDIPIYFVTGVKNSIGWGYSPVGSYRTPVSPFAACATCTPTVPVISMSAVLDYWGMSSSRIHTSIKILVGGYSQINPYGLCYFTSEDLRDTFDPRDSESLASLVTSGSCRDFGVLPIGTVLPYTRGHTYNNLIPDTEYFFKAYAVNDTGVGYATTTLKTGVEFFDFWNSGMSIIVDENDFNASTGNYDKITVRVHTGDFSSSFVNPKRKISVSFHLDEENDGIYDRIEYATSTVNNGGSGSFPTDLIFTNVQLGTIKVKTIINDPLQEYSPEKVSGNGNTRTATYLLKDPYAFTDTTSGTDEGTGAGIITNPLLSLKVSPTITRIGKVVNLDWKMLNLPGLVCNILGPSGFGVAGIYPITSYDDTKAVRDILSGSITTTELYHTQVFKFHCTFTSTGEVFSTEARVITVGVQTET